MKPLKKKNNMKRKSKKKDQKDITVHGCYCYKYKFIHGISLKHVAVPS